MGDELAMNHDDSKLTLHDIPIFLWVLGLIFAGVGAFIFLESEQPPAAIGIIFPAVGLGMLLFASVLTITADRLTRSLKLEDTEFLHTASVRR
jgi:hypothetical protein